MPHVPALPFLSFLSFICSDGIPLSSALPYLIQEPLLCNHPHAMAKTPSRQTYNAPFMTKAAVIMFILLSRELNRAY